MSRSEELWGIIKQQIVDEGLIDVKQLERLDRPVLTGKVSVEDWALVIENALIKEENHA